MSQPSKAAQGDQSTVLENAGDLLSGATLISIKVTAYGPHSYTEASPRWQHKKAYSSVWVAFGLPSAGKWQKNWFYIRFTQRPATSGPGAVGCFPLCSCSTPEVGAVQGTGCVYVDASVGHGGDGDLEGSCLLYKARCYYINKASEQTKTNKPMSQNIVPWYNTFLVCTLGLY